MPAWYLSQNRSSTKRILKKSSLQIFQDINIERFRMTLPLLLPHCLQCRKRRRATEASWKTSDAKIKGTTKAAFARTRSWMRAWSSKAIDRLFDPKKQKPESETRTTGKISYKSWRVGPQLTEFNECGKRQWTHMFPKNLKEIEISAPGLLPKNTENLQLNFSKSHQRRETTICTVAVLHPHVGNNAKVTTHEIFT